MNRWILEMREFSYHIQYVNGKYNYVADSSSRPVLVTYRTCVKMPSMVPAGEANIVEAVMLIP